MAGGPGNHALSGISMEIPILMKSPGIVHDNKFETSGTYPGRSDEGCAERRMNPG